MLIRQKCLMLIAAASLSACSGPAVSEEALAPAALRAALTIGNGTNLNGKDLNGKDLNGKDLNGPGLNQALISVSYAGATRQGVPLDSVWLQGSEFWGVQGGMAIHGMDFSQARFIGTLGSGDSLTLRVDSLVPPTLNDDVWTYQVSYWKAETQGWAPICVHGDGTPASAIAVAGRWNYLQGVAGGGDWINDTSAFTFACEGGAISKCIHLGYKPWTTGTALADHHHACTRLIRADYCGNGSTYTEAGKWVNLYDALVVQQDDAGWLLEAEWDRSGARCLSSHNRASVPVTCASGKTLSPCTQSEGFGSGTLLVSETP